MNNHVKHNVLQTELAECVAEYAWTAQFSDRLTRNTLRSVARGYLALTEHLSDMLGGTLSADPPETPGASVLSINSAMELVAAVWRAAVNAPGEAPTIYLLVTEVAGVWPERKHRCQALRKDLADLFGWDIKPEMSGDTFIPELCTGPPPGGLGCLGSFVAVAWSSPPILG